MFGKIKTVLSGFTGLKLALIAAPVALGSAAGLAQGATAGADRWDHHDRWDHDRHEVYVRRGPSVVIEARPRIVLTQPAPVVVAQPAVVVSRADVVPSDLHLAAYQTRDSVLVLITGSNAGAGYATSLISADCTAWTPTLQMRNCPPNGDVIAGVATPFALNAAIHVTHSVSSLNVVVAGQMYQVPVTQVESLS